MLGFETDTTLQNREKEVIWKVIREADSEVIREADSEVIRENDLIRRR